MRFAHPEVLWLMLAVLPVLILAQVMASMRRSRLLAQLGSPELLGRMAASVSRTQKVLRSVYVTVAVALLAAALARPQIGGRAKLERQRGLDIVVALDFSKSMLARDVYPSRLERAKRELEQLMDQLGGDRIGLVAFAGETLIYPPTTDYAAAKLFWRDMEPADMPVGGTAVGRALAASIDLLTRLREKGGKTRSQVILLLTDGEDTESEPMTVAEDAARLGIKIYSVGIGSRSGELIPEVDEEGKVVGYLRGADNKYVTSRLGEEMLSQLAKVTAGEYIRADTKRFGVEQVERALSGLKRTENEARLIKHHDDVFELAVLPAFLLLIGEVCVNERRRRT